MFGLVKNKAAVSAPAERRRFSFANPLTWFQATGGKKAAGLYEKSDYGVWAETINPLRGLTSSKAQDIFDRARRGIYAELAYIYQEIEAADPTLFICTERREACTGAADWRAVTCNPDRTQGWDDALAEEQQSYLSYAYGRAGDEISALAEHLERGFFRGFAHARPVYEGDGVVGFETLDQWNFARDPSTGEWWWNPDASYVPNAGFAPIPPDELITVQRSRHIDYAALAIAIRVMLGEKKYGIWIERYGIPPVTVIMPEFADKSEESAYMEAAQKLARAGSGALPFGSQVNYATEARGANPFTDFLRHQQELTVMMATGGILTTLAAPDSGSLAGGAHENTWRAVVARDIRVTGRALNRSVTRKLLADKFPGRPMLAMFEFSTEPKPTATAVFEDAGKAKLAGYLVDQDDLEERTGYTLRPDASVLPAVAAAQPSAPVAAAPETKPAEAAAEATNVAATAMNGAQVTALLDIITKVSLGEIDRSVAPAVIKAAFPLLAEAEIASMIPPVKAEKPQASAEIPAAPVANKADGVAKALQNAPVASDALPPGEETQKQPPPENAKKTASTAKASDPVEAALKAIEGGATTEEALDAFDAAAKTALLPQMVAQQAERIAAEMDEAAAAGKDGK